MMAQLPGHKLGQTGFEVYEETERGLRYRIEKAGLLERLRWKTGERQGPVL